VVVSAKRRPKMTDVSRVFLSASIPLPTRNEVYFRTADVIAIRDAIRALTIVISQKQCELVFGDHPAILPMIRLQLAQLGLPVGRFVNVYVSSFFKTDFPEDLAAFEKTIVVDAVDGDREKSLAAMRGRMLEGPFCCGIFVGGMEGVEQEFDLFCAKHPTVPAYPIASSGAAAAIIYEREIAISRKNPALRDEVSYLGLMRSLVRG
jgi:hypothetical protein